MIRTVGTYVDDKPLVLALMCWPDDEPTRNQFEAAHKVRQVLAVPNADRTVDVSPNLLRILLEAPPWNELRSIQQTSVRAGFVVGQLLLTMFLLDRYADQLPPRGGRGATLSKAVAVAAKWGKNGGTLGDGHPFPSSDRTIRTYWKRFRSVAHLWAALSVNVAAPWAPDRETMSPEHFATFLGVAAGFQKFGLDFVIFNRTTKTEERLLDPAALWRLDEEKHPSMTLRGDTFEDLEPAMLESLWSYEG